MVTRIFYAGDLHGSTVCWRKFLNAANKYNANVLILNGDLTGKGIIPIVKMGEGKYFTSFLGKEYHLKNRREVEEIKEKIESASLYSLVADEDEIRELQGNKERLTKIFEDLIVERLEKWLNLIENRVNKDVKIIVSPGNDDYFCIDDVLKECERVIYPLNKVVYVDNHHPMISYEYTNPTPWNTPREKPEEELKKDLEKLFKMVHDYENLICMFHCPPFDSAIDTAPKLDKDKRIVGGAFGIVKIPVGSKAVRECIEKYQPQIGLHSHIHESPGLTKIGRTICINPGSEYTEGILSGYVIDLDPKGITKRFHIRG